MIRYWEEDTDTEIGKPFDLKKHDKEMSNKWLDKVKQAREEIEDNLFVAYGEYDNPQSYYEVVEVKDVLKILDKLIESEVRKC